jgi:hypothetical protein
VKFLVRGGAQTCVCGDIMRLTILTTEVFVFGVSALVDCSRLESLSGVIFK